MSSRKYPLLFTLIISIVLYQFSHPAIARVLHTIPQISQNIVITENGGLRCLIIAKTTIHENRLRGCLYPIQPLALVTSDKQSILAALFVKKDPKRVLIIGLGTGNVTMAFHHAVPSAYIETVEVNADMIELAQSYFFYNESKILPTYAVDGRQFVENALASDISYDIVIINQYHETNDFKHLMTVEFLTSVKQLLNPDGVVIANTETDSLYDHLSTTYAAVFGEFFNLKTDDGKYRIIIATKDIFPDVEVIRTNALVFAEMFWQDFGVNVNDLLVLMDTNQDWDRSARTITDSYFPLAPINQSGIDHPMKLFKQALDNHLLLTLIAMVLFFSLIILIIIKLFDFIRQFRSESLGP